MKHCEFNDRKGAGTRMRPYWAVGGAFMMIVLLLHSACATRPPMTGQAGAGSLASWMSTENDTAVDAGGATELGLKDSVVLDVAIIEPGLVATRPVPISSAELRKQVERLARGLRFHGRPRELAAELLRAQDRLQDDPSEAAVSVPASGRFVAEGDPRGNNGRGVVYSILPEAQTGLVPLTPEAEAALRARYEQFCIARGGGDCLGLLDDGPYLRSDDRRTLALALAFGSVLDETYAALGRELSPRAILASVMWAVGMYLGLWLLPEPATKGVAAALTVLLVAWLGVDALWGLMDGWAVLVMQTREATTFDELREAGAGFAKVLGTDAARTIILAVTALSGRTLSEAATLLRSLPGHEFAQLRFVGQGGSGWMLAQVERVRSVTAAANGMMVITVSPASAVAGAMMSHNNAASSSSGASSANEVYRHCGGNRQVEILGQRWHLPRGVSVGDIPHSDALGDQLQAAAREAAAHWGPRYYSTKVKAAITKMLQKGLVHRAELLERQARGRWVEEQVRKRFNHLSWNDRGVDITGPSGQRYHYEILSGTESNFELHGRRMTSIFFRMIFF